MRTIQCNCCPGIQGLRNWGICTLTFCYFLNIIHCNVWRGEMKYMFQKWSNLQSCPKLDRQVASYGSFELNPQCPPSLPSLYFPPPSPFLPFFPFPPTPPSLPYPLHSPPSLPYLLPSSFSFSNFPPPPLIPFSLCQNFLFFMAPRQIRQKYVIWAGFLL